MTFDKDADSILAADAAQHHGVFRGAHAHMAGLTDRQIEQRTVDGRWNKLYRDVYRVAGSPVTWEGDLLGACWAGGFRAVASHRSAAELHGMPGRQRALAEITCPRWRRARQSRVIVHETKAHDAADVTVVRGIAVTTFERTLFDLGGVCRPRLVELALENALRRGLTTEIVLCETVRRVSRRGRPGGPTLRGLLAVRDPNRRPTESEMETRLVQAIRADGLPEPTTQHEVWRGSAFIARVDVAYPDERIAIEYDSDEFHSGRAATGRDRERRHRLVAAGWLPIDVGPADLRSGGVLACSAIAEALRGRGLRPAS